MRFTFITLIFVFTFIKVSYGKGGVYTPMEIDNHPCTPQKLKVKSDPYKFEPLSLFAIQLLLKLATYSEDT